MGFHPAVGSNPTARTEGVRVPRHVAADWRRRSLLVQHLTPFTWRLLIEVGDGACIASGCWTGKTVRIPPPARCPCPGRLRRPGRRAGAGRPSSPRWGPIPIRGRTRSLCGIKTYRCAAGLKRVLTGDWGFETEVWRLVSGLRTTNLLPRRGCSSMVELQPSKLATGVRFPSPAPETGTVGGLPP